jgi:hypothetical protein
MNKTLGGFFGVAAAEPDAAAGVEVVSRCQGNWLSHLDWDGER